MVSILAGHAHKSGALEGLDVKVREGSLNLVFGDAPSHKGKRGRCDGGCR
jgi:hypothetical protein